MANQYRKLIKHTCFVTIVMIMTALSGVNAYATQRAANRTYTLEGGNKPVNRVPIPMMYEAVSVINNLGDYGFLAQPEDLYIDAHDNLFVADTFNDRVLKMTRAGEVLAVYDSFYNDETGDYDYLYDPRGIYASEDGTVFIADTGNNRIIKLTEDGEFIRQYLRPESPLLNERFIFDPSKISVSPIGYIYVVKGSSILSLDEEGGFRGYVGTKELGFDVRRWFMNIFATRAQKDRVAKEIPDSYTNLVISNDALIYATLGSANQNKGQIRKLNSVGKNIYPNEKYGEEYMAGGYSYFIDLALDKNGIISALEQSAGKVYQYDQEGNILGAFGGAGNTKSNFQKVSSIAVDSEGYIYISDTQLNNIQVFKPTHFVQMIHMATTNYFEGDYAESKVYWEEVLRIDANYSLAHAGIARVYYKEEKWKESMDSFLLAEDKDGYSKAFLEYRHSLFRQYFGWVILAVAALAAGLYFGIIYLKGLAGRMNHKIVYNEVEVL